MFSLIRSLKVTKHFGLLEEILLVIGTSCLIALFGKIAIPLPYTPVPIATQPQLILLLAAFLGPKRAACSVLLFLGQGAIGLPVFAEGTAGIAKLLGPTGGYLVGYVVAAWVVGFCVHSLKKPRFFNGFLCMLLGNLIILSMGSAYLGLFVGMGQALALGVVPFLIGDFLKLLVVTKIWSSLTKAA